MGTNYVVREKNARLAQSRFVEKIGAIFEKISQDLSSIPDGIEEEIAASNSELKLSVFGRHLGKRSGGWVFCFEAYPELKLMSWREWKQYIIENDLQIVSEYGVVLSLKSFETVLSESKTWKGKPSMVSVLASGSHFPHNRLQYIDDEGYEFMGEEFS